MHFLNLVTTTNAKEVECERVSDFNSGGSFGSVKTCFMDKKTTIDTPNVTFSTRDNSIGAISFRYNNKIKFLPIKVDEKFPNLLSVQAVRCSIKEISKLNFKGLSKLTFLDLSSNQIEKIASETFEDLTSLEELYLCKKISIYCFSICEFFSFSDGNKIKFMNGKLFKPMTNLKSVYLNLNVCIDDSFFDSTQIATLDETLAEKCRFDEPEILRKRET